MTIVVDRRHSPWSCGCCGRVTTHTRFTSLSALLLLLLLLMVILQSSRRTAQNPVGIHATRKWSKRLHCWFFSFTNDDKISYNVIDIQGKGFEILRVQAGKLFIIGSFDFAVLQLREMVSLTEKDVNFCNFFLSCRSVTMQMDFGWNGDIVWQKMYSNGNYNRSYDNYL